MENKFQKEYLPKTIDFITRISDLKKEMVQAMVELVREHGPFHLNTYQQYKEDDGMEFEDLTTAFIYEEFGYASHTYVIEDVTLKTFSTPDGKEYHSVDLHVHQFEYEGWGDKEDVSAWDLSLDDLSKLYDDLLSKVQMELEEKENEKE